jgi:hypothetical protein
MDRYEMLIRKPINRLYTREPSVAQDLSCSERPNTLVETFRPAKSQFRAGGRRYRHLEILDVSELHGAEGRLFTPFAVHLLDVVRDSS